MSESTDILRPKRIFGNNIIWFNLSGISGKKYYHMFFAFLLYTCPYILMMIILIFERKNISIAFPIIATTILYLIEVISTILGGCSDPGIIPRQRADYFYNTNRPILKYVINGHLLTLNYCNSCSAYRPPRTSHCSLCDNCVQRFDHHCLWLGTCIGKRNYRYFYFLTGSINLSALFQICFSLYYIINHTKLLINKENYSKLILWGLSALSLYDLLFAIFFVGKLFILHTYLVCQSKTFYENIKKKFRKIPKVNPFKKYFFYTWKRIIFKMPPKSYLMSYLKGRLEKRKIKIFDEEEKEEEINENITNANKNNEEPTNNLNDSNNEEKTNNDVDYGDKNYKIFNNVKDGQIITNNSYNENQSIHMKKVLKPIDKEKLKSKQRNHTPFNKNLKNIISINFSETVTGNQELLGQENRELKSNQSTEFNYNHKNKKNKFPEISKSNNLIIHDMETITNNFDLESKNRPIIEDEDENEIVMNNKFSLNLDEVEPHLEQTHEEK